MLNWLAAGDVARSPKYDWILPSPVGIFVSELVAVVKPICKLVNCIRRSTFFWVLDNTFYEVLYYFLTHYGQENAKLAKHLRHQKATLFSNMRNDAFERAQKELSAVDATTDFEKYFTDVYISVAEQLAAEVDRFNGGTK